MESLQGRCIVGATLPPRGSVSAGQGCAIRAGRGAPRLCLLLGSAILAHLRGRQPVHGWFEACMEVFFSGTFSESELHPQGLTHQFPEIRMGGMYHATLSWMFRLKQVK